MGIKIYSEFVHVHTFEIIDANGNAHISETLSNE